MTAKSFIPNFCFPDRSGSNRGPRLALALSVALITIGQALPVLAAGLPPVQQPTQPASLVPTKAISAATGNAQAVPNLQAASASNSNSLPAPTVPSTASVITPAIAANLAGVVNPTKLVIDVGNLQNGVYSVAGNFTNTNNLVFVSTNSNVHSATLSVTGAIFNPVGASISTMTPGGYANAVANLNLVLLAATGIYNAGNITSAGSLAMTAPVIVNALPSSAGSAPLPVMQAMGGNLSMQTSTLFNQGTIAAAVGNINIANLTNSLAINALAGTFNAANGQGIINIGTQNLTDQLNLQILGGDFIAQTLNLTAGTTGIVSMQINSLSGQVNVTAGDAYIGCNTGNLNLNNILVGGDPFANDSNGNIVFSGITDVATIAISTPDSVLSQGATTIMAKSGIVIDAGKNIDLTGVTSISTQSVGIGMSAGSGYIAIPGVHISSNGSPIQIVANQDLNMAGATIDSSSSAGAGGYIIIVSQNGSVNLGSGSLITTGNIAPGGYAVEICAYNAVNLGDVISPAGSVVIASGMTTPGSAAQGWTIDPFNAVAGLGTGGITAGTIATALAGTSSSSLVFVRSTNGTLNLNNLSADGGTVVVLSSSDLAIQQGISNTSMSASGGFVQVQAGNNLQIGTGIINDALVGSGGTISVSAGMANGLTLGKGVGNIFISNNAAGSGGITQVSNYGSINYTPGGIQATAHSGSGSQIMLGALAATGSSLPSKLTVTGNLNGANGGANGNGGLLELYSTGDLNIQGANLSANGSGTGSGGQIQLIATGNLDPTASTASATGGNLGSGGNISANVGSYTGGGLFSIKADGSQFGSGGSVNISIVGNGTFSNGDVSISAQGGNGGSIAISAGKDLTVNSTVFNVNPLVNGNGGSIGLGAGGNLNLLTQSLNANGLGAGNGGSINLVSQGGDFTVGNGGTQLYARGGNAGGSGGQVSVNAGGNLTIAADAVIDVGVAGSNGNGGSVLLSGGNAAAGSVSINSNLSANGAGAGSGGLIQIVSQSGGNISLNGNLSANAGAAGASGGQVTLALLGSSAGSSINLNGNINADGGTSGAGGAISAFAAGSGNTINVGGSGNAFTLSAQSAGTANGGNISLQSSGTGPSDININGGSSLLAGSTGGSGGQVTVSASGNLNINSVASVIDASSASASGGQITLAAGAGTSGTSGSGALSINGNVTANSAGSSNNASITLSQNSTQSMQIGVLAGAAPGSGIVSATNQTGKGGSLNLSNANGDLNVALNETVSLQGSSGMGTINANSTSNINISGPATLTGSLNGSGLSYTVSAGGAGSTIGVQQVSSTGGNVTIKATAADGSIAFASGSTIKAATGSIEVGAPTITFAGASTLTMDNAGVLKVDSGNQSSSLALNFAAGSTVTFNVTQGGSVRPGTIAIGPTGNGALNLNSAGAASLDFTGGTVSMVSSGGAINLSANLSLNSNAFDSTQNLGMEIVASAGDVNLNSAISARQLNVSTVGSGNINLASEISSPTVVLSVQGAGSIKQTGIGSIGIGTLILQSASGDIGSAANPINANVLELQVTSGGSAYINNASTIDVKTSTVTNLFQLNNQGAVAIESNVTAGSLNVTATGGSISIFNPVNGINGVTLASTGAGNTIDIAAGTQLSSTAGNIALSTGGLVLDGSILVQGSSAQVTVNSSGDLNLSGAGGLITASGANSFVSLSGSNSVSFASSYILNAGSTGTVQIQTSNIAGPGVTLGSSAKLTAAGGSQLNIFTNAITFANGSSVSTSNSAVGMTVQSLGGSSLTVNVGGSNIAISSAGGAIQFIAGAAGALNFQNPGAGLNSLSVSGGNLVTLSSAADTSLNSVNLSSSGNIQMTVSGANLNLNGNNVSSSQSGGVIVLQDPNGITLNGGGTVGFSAGLSGSIFVEALSPAANLQINGNTQFNAGAAGSVTFNATGSINFANGSVSTVNGGAKVNIIAPVVSFGSNSKLVASGASSISMTSTAGLDVMLPTSGTATISTNGGAGISISAQAGNSILFSQASAGSTSTLNVNGAPLTISTSNANVTIDPNVVLNSNNSVSVLTPGGTLLNNGQIVDPGAGSTTIIQAAGNLIVNKNVSANNLIIETTANNGNITLSADVNVVNALTVSANGKGNIIQTSGLLTAASISLMSGSGHIGSENGAIQIKTADLSVSTSSTAYVNSHGAVTLDSYTVGGGLHLNASGNIKIGAANAQNVSLNSNAIFNAGPNGNVSVTALNLISIAADLKIRVKDSSFTLAAPNISIGQGSSLRSTGDLSLSGNVSGKDFSLASKAGNLQISGQLSGREVTLATRANGNIILSGNMSASNELHINAGGNISQSSGLLAAPELSLSSERGNIGSVNNSINISASNLSAEAERGSVNINASGNLTVDDSRSGGDFNLNASGALTIGNVRTDNGSITLSSSGAMQVERGAYILANEGNLTLQNTDTQKGTITIGKDASLIALSSGLSHDNSGHDNNGHDNNGHDSNGSSGSGNGLGNVFIAIGQIPSTPVKGSRPSNLGLSQLRGGTAYFGANGITVQGKDNQVDAWGSNVIFSTGTRPSSAIVLQGGVLILADPPAAAQAPVANSALSAVASPALTHTSLPTANSPSFVFNNPMPLPAFSREGSVSQIVESESASNAHDLFQPIACVTAVTEAAIQQGSGLSDIVERSTGNSVYTRSARYENHSTFLVFQKGEMLVNARHATEINSASAHVTLKAGSCAYVKSDGQGIEVYNLCEEHQGAITVTVSGKQFELSAGQRLIVGQQSRVAVRHESTHRLSEKTARVGEFPLLSLIGSSELVKKLMHSNVKEDRQLATKLFKMAACLTLVTSAHGAFHN